MAILAKKNRMLGPSLGLDLLALVGKPASNINGTFGSGLWPHFSSCSGAACRQPLTYIIYTMGYSSPPPYYCVGGGY